MSEQTTGHAPDAPLMLDPNLLTRVAAVTAPHHEAMAEAIHAAYGDHDAPMLFSVALATWLRTSCGRS